MQQQSSVLEGLWKTYQANAEWIRATDTKAGASLAAAGVLVGVVASALKDNRADILRSPVLGVCVVLGTTLLVLSVIYGVNCISPTLGVSAQARAGSVGDGVLGRAGIGDLL